MIRKVKGIHVFVISCVLLVIGAWYYAISQTLNPLAGVINRSDARLTRMIEKQEREQAIERRQEGQLPAMPSIATSQMRADEIPRVAESVQLIPLNLPQPQYTDAPTQPMTIEQSAANGNYNGGFIGSEPSWGSGSGRSRRGWDSAPRSEHVSGYTRRDGTHVNSYSRRRRR